MSRKPGVIPVRYIIAVLLYSGLALPAGAAELRPAARITEAGATTPVPLVVNKQSLDLKTLMTLRVFDVDVTTNWNASGVFQGVLLSDVLALAGVDDFSRLSLIANNDYKVTMEAGAPGFDQALVAWSLDGVLLDPLDKGPFWLIWPNRAQALLAGEDSGALWIWSLATIRKMR